MTMRTVREFCLSAGPWASLLGAALFLAGCLASLPTFVGIGAFVLVVGGYAAIYGHLGSY